MSCSYCKQHISRPQGPLIFSGLSGSCWSLAIRIDTALKLCNQVDEHEPLPHTPMVPMMRA
jgi:hypothetical protein